MPAEFDYDEGDDPYLVGDGQYEEEIDYQDF